MAYYLNIDVDSYLNSKEFKYDCETIAEELLIDNPAWFDDAMADAVDRGLSNELLFTNPEKFAIELRDMMIEYAAETEYVQEKAEEAYVEYIEEMREFKGSPI